MLKETMQQLRTAITVLLILTLITGIAYPLIVTALAQMFFPFEANGSLIQQQNTLIGSKLIGQPFSANEYFWGRPSATNPYPYNGAASSGSNLGPSNPDLLAQIKTRMQILQAAHPQTNQAIPIDLVTTSASGLDPEISPQAARYQVNRVAAARNLSPQKVQALVQQHTLKRSFGLLGEPRVNVLELNIALDNLRVKND